MKPKKIIKGIVKTTGKYTLKGIGKGAELTARGAVKVIDVLVKNQKMQKIATGAGILAASVMIPPVGIGLLATLELKYIIDKSLLGKDTGIIQEIKDSLEIANKVTKKACDKISTKTLNKLGKDIKKYGTRYQDKIDDMFK